MTFAIESKERLPDWTYETFERERMNQLTQILERRFLVMEESLIDIQLTQQGVIGGDTFAPIVHTHGVTEITDYPPDVLTVSNSNDDLFLAAIADVVDTVPSANQVLKYSPTAFGGNGGWILDDFASAGNSLASLTDTNIGAPIIDGSILSYDLVSARWVDTDAATLPYVVKSGDQMTGNLIFGDTISVAFGDASDGLINWNGADLIQRVATGSIRLQVASGEDGIVIDSNGRVTLYDDDIATFRTGVSTVEVWDGDSWEDVVLDTRTLDINGAANELVVDLAGPLDLSADRVWEIGLADDPIVPGVASITIPVGTTAQEPTAANGMIRWDSDLDTLRFAEGVTPSWRSAVWEGGAFHDGFSDFVGNEHVDHTLTLTVAGDANEITVAEGAQDITVSRTFNVGIADNPVLPGSISATIPAGVTGSEPGAVVGMMRYDTTTGKLRAVDAGVWVDVIGGGGGTVDTVVGTTDEIVVDSSDAANPIVGIADNPVIPGTSDMILPIGTTAQQPTAADGMIRYDSDHDRIMTAEGPTVAWRHNMSMFAEPTAQGQFAAWFASGQDTFLQVTMLETDFSSTLSLSGSTTSSHLQFAHTNHADDIAAIFADGTNATPLSIRTQQLGKGIELRTAQAVAGSNVSLITHTDAGVDLGWDNQLVFGTIINGAYLDNHAAGDTDFEIYQDSVLKYTLQHWNNGAGTDEIRHISAVAGVPFVFSDGTDVSIRAIPNAGVDFGYAGNVVLQTQVNGIIVDSGVAATDTVLSLYDNGVQVYRLFHDQSASIIKHRMINAGDVYRIEEGNATNIAAEFTPNASQVFSQAGDEKLRTASDTLGAAEINKGGQWDEVHAGPITVGTGTTRANNTITDDADLTDSVSANRTYKVELFLEIENASATPDFQFQFSVPTSASFDGISEHVDQDNTNNGIIGVNDATAETITLQAAEPKYVYIRGTLVVAGTAGTFALGWAQANTDALNLTNLRATSWMTLVDIT